VPWAHRYMCDRQSASLSILTPITATRTLTAGDVGAVDRHHENNIP
jgi:hypothetical protein